MFQMMGETFATAKQKVQSVDFFGRNKIGFVKLKSEIYDRNWGFVQTGQTNGGEACGNCKYIHVLSCFDKTV